RPHDGQEGVRAVAGARPGDRAHEAPHDGHLDRRAHRRAEDVRDGLLGRYVAARTSCCCDAQRAPSRGPLLLWDAISYRAASAARRSALSANTTTAPTRSPCLRIGFTESATGTMRPKKLA